MKGNYEGFQWVTTRKKNLEFRDEPNVRVYEFMVTHPDRPNWGFRDSWTCRNGVYEGTNGTHTDTRQRDMANFVIHEYAFRSFYE